MKFYKEEIKEKEVYDMFEKLDYYKEEMLAEKDADDSIKEITKLICNEINNQINTIIIDPKNEELIKD